MDSEPLDTEIGEEIQADDVNANLIPPETLIVKMRGRPAGSKKQGKGRKSDN